MQPHFHLFKYQGHPKIYNFSGVKIYLTNFFGSGARCFKNSKNVSSEKKVKLYQKIRPKNSKKFTIKIIENRTSKNGKNETFNGIFKHCDFTRKSDLKAPKNDKNR